MDGDGQGLIPMFPKHFPKVCTNSPGIFFSALLLRLPVLRTLYMNDQLNGHCKKT